MNPAVECPVDKIADFVNDALQPEQQAAILKHLDECEACRRRLINAAGSAEDWQLAGEALSLEPSRTSADQQTVGGENAAARPIDTGALLQLLAPSDDPRAAGRIGPFEVVGIVGSGGMGIVFKARDPALDRFVAVKMLAPHLASSASARRRFAREARAAAAVIHENVIVIYQVAHWNDLPYLVMPYLPDPTLQQRIESEGKLKLESALLIGLQIARGLAAAHTQGLVHRDVKPANVLLSKGTERAVITDFGLARATDDASLTRAGMLTGTPHYMSPEQARGEFVDQRSDLFSLGSVLFAMIAGRPPIDRELGSETIAQIARCDLPPLDVIQPDCPTWFVRLVSWLHRPLPDKRPESADQVADLLEQCLAHCRQPDKTELPEALAGRRFKRRRVLTAAASLSAIAALVLISFAITSTNTPRAEPETQKSGSTVTGPQAASLEITETPQWHSVDSGIQSLDDETTRLEFELESVWDVVPHDQ